MSARRGEEKFEHRRMQTLRTRSTKNGWLVFLLVVYVTAFCFLLVAVLVTAHVMSHPETGLQEATPIVRSYVSKHGLVLGLFIVILHNSAVIFSPWPFFFSYLLIKRRYRWKNYFFDSIQFSLIAAVGFLELIFWSLDAASDVSHFLFCLSPYAISELWEFLITVSPYLKLTGFLVLFLFIFCLLFIGKKLEKVELDFRYIQKT